jgi:endo-1,4-beta-xylanase
MDIVQSIRLRTVSHKKIVITAVTLFFFILIIINFWPAAGVSFSGIAAPNNRFDLLQSGWNYMPGVNPQDNGLHVSYVGQAIVRQDGSPGQANPATNLYGTHLYATKDYTLTATLKDIKGGASFRLYSDAPIVQDEFRIEPKSLDFVFKDSTLTIKNWPGYKKQNVYQQKPISTSSYAIEPQASTVLTLQRKGNQLLVSVNGKQTTTFAYDKLSTNALWFGLGAETSGDSYLLSNLGVETTAPSSDVHVITTQDASVLPTPASSALQSLAKNKRPDFLIGAATALAPSVADSKYANLAYGGNFGAITTENVLKWQFIHPQPTVYDFTQADALVAIAKKNNLKVQGHTLVFGEANPQWVQDLPVITATDKERVKQVMIDHITQTVSHFKGQVYAWDVVNEPLADNDSDAVTLRPHKWFAAMGEEYITTAFRTAHQADPNAKLYINDYGLEADGDRWDAMLALVTKLKAAGVPIDGVGFEAHVYESGDKIDPTVLRAHIQALAATGVTSHVSEMDVYDEDGPAVQAQQYADIFNACFSEPSCVSWSTWGVTDRYDLFIADNNQLATGHDLLWDEQSNPTAGVAKIQEILSK